MQLTKVVPARRRLTAAVAVGAMALTIAGLHAPGAGAASQQPPTCQSFTVADAQGVATGPVTGEVRTAPIPDAQTGTQSGGAPQAATGQPAQSGGTDIAPNAPGTVSCVIDAAGVPSNVCVVTIPGAPGQAGGAGVSSTESGTTGQDEAIAGGAQPGAGQQTVPDQGPAGAQAQTGGAAPAGNQVLDPREQAAATAGAAGTQGAQGTQEGAAAAGQAGAGGVSAEQPNQPFTGAGGENMVISDAKPGEISGACGTGGNVGIDAPADVFENGTGSATADAVPALVPAEQAPATGCEETVISEHPLPGGGTIKVSVTPC